MDELMLLLKERHYRTNVYNGEEDMKLRKNEEKDNCGCVNFNIKK